MRRTQIYITDEQERRIEQRARDAGIAKAELIRRFLDAGLGLDDGAEVRRQAIRASAGAAAGDDEWPVWLARVRGGGADARLSRLGS